MILLVVVQKMVCKKTSMILKKTGETVTVFCTNSAPEAFSGVLRCGWTSFDGAKKAEKETPFTLEAFAPATPVAVFEDLPDLTENVLYAAASGLDTAFFRAHDFREYKIPGKAKLTLTEISRTPEALTFTVTSDVFAHAVHFHTKDDVLFSDLYFNLLPGETKTVVLRDPGALTLADLAPDCVFPEAASR